MGEEEINLMIGKSLRRARERAGYNLKDFAQLVDKSYQQVQKYETGKNRLPAAQIVLFAKVLLIEPSDLLPEVF